MSVYVATRVYADAADTRGDSANWTAYATARERTDATLPVSASGLIGQSFSTPNYRIGQYFGVFDTSGLSANPATGIFSFNRPTAGAVAGDVLELRTASAITNLIAGSAIASQVPLLGSWTVTTGSGRVTFPIDVSAMARSASCSMLLHSQKQRLNTAPTGVESPQISLADNTGTTNDPYLDITPQPWRIVGVSAVVETTTTTLTLTEPAGVADGDLLVACIASRSTATTAIANTGWTAVNSQNNNNTLTTTSALASGTMLYQVRAGTPGLSFTLPAGISVAMGRIVAYRGSATTTPLDASTAATTAINTLAVSVTGLSTTQDDDLIVAMAAGGQEAAWSAFSNATTPLTASGASDTTTAPSTTAWIERADSLTATGADTSLAIFDAVRTGAGATGNLTATASLGAGHVVIAGAFKIAAAAPSAITGTGAATLSASAAASGVEGAAGTAIATLALAAAASGTVEAPVSEVTGAASATLGLTAAASGIEGVKGAASATIALSGAAIGVHGVSGSASSILALSASATGEIGAATAAGLMGIWTGSVWAKKPIKIWTGSAWVQKPIKRWNGSAWV